MAFQHLSIVLPRNGMGIPNHNVENMKKVIACKFYSPIMCYRPNNENPSIDDMVLFCEKCN